MTDKLNLKSSHEVIYTVNVADVESIFYCKPTDPDILTVLMKDGKRLYCDEVCPVDFLQEEPVSEVWHDASEEPDDMSHCLIFYGCKESVGHYLHYESVLYNKKEKMFVTQSFPHSTGYKVEQKSIDGGCVAEVYKDKRDRISISDITQWCYLCDLHNLSNVQRTGKNWKESVSEDFEKIIEEIAEPTILNAYGTKELARRLRNTICGTSISEELEEACEQLAENARKHKAETSSPFFSPTDYKQGVIDGAQWQKEHLWKPADGDELPEIDKEVVAFQETFPTDVDVPSLLKIVIAHRPNPEGYDGKSITTEQVEHYTPKTYGKGGWNIPDVKYWLDVELPKEIEL